MFQATVSKDNGDVLGVFEEDDDGKTRFVVVWHQPDEDEDEDSSTVMNALIALNDPTCELSHNDKLDNAVVKALEGFCAVYGIDVPEGHGFVFDSGYQAERAVTAANYLAFFDVVREADTPDWARQAIYHGFTPPAGWLLDVDKFVRTALEGYFGCTFHERSGIYDVTTPDGRVWDFTVPLRIERKNNPAK